MKVSSINTKYNPNFGNCFYNATRELDSSAMLSRGLIDTFGCTIPWIIMTNNDIEKKEKIRRYLANYVLIWLTPFITITLSNRFAMRYLGKLTKHFWSNNHKAIHISNEYLKDTKSMMTELNNIAKKTDTNPLEAIFNKLNPNKYEQKLNLKELLDSVGGDEEKLRKKLISSKNAVFVSDCIFTFGGGATILFANNEITKKKTGQSGFSAEMSMADKETVERRAENYEKNKKKKYLAAMGIVSSAAIAMSLAAFATLYSKSSNKIIQKLRNNSKLFDYNRGIYMSRLPLFLNNFAWIGVSLLGARNSTEQKDLVVRHVIGDTIFFGGDLILASLFANLSDRIFGTKLRNDDSSNKSLFRKIFPKVKSFKQILDDVKQGKIASKNKKIAAGIFWTNMLLLMIGMGYAVPTAINIMIKKDVEKYVQTHSEVE